MKRKRNTDLYQKFYQVIFKKENTLQNRQIFANLKGRSFKPLERGNHD